MTERSLLEDNMADGLGEDSGHVSEDGDEDNQKRETRQKGVNLHFSFSLKQETIFLYCWKVVQGYVVGSADKL